MEIGPRCRSKKFWSLSAGQLRCSRCGLTRKVSQHLWKKRSISPYWQGRLIEYFGLEVPAYRLRFQVPYSQLTIQRCFRMFRETIYHDNIKDLVPLSGEIEMEETMFDSKNIVFAIYPEAVKSLLFLSHHALRRLGSHILPNIPKLEVYAILMTGLLMPSYLFAVFMW